MTSAAADAYLPVWVSHLPADMFFGRSGRMHPNIEHYVRLGVIRIVAGPERCHVSIDVRRPYRRSSRTLAIASEEQP